MPKTRAERMIFMFNMFGQPYLDVDTGANLGGGGIPADTAGQQTTTQQADTTQTGGQQQTEPFLTIKYNKDEVPLDKNRAIEYAQKGMNYDHVYNELTQLRNHPGMSYLNTQAQRYGMTVDQYVQAVQEAEEREQLNQLVQNNIPQEYAQEMLENRKFRQQYQAERQANQQRETTNRMYQEFLDTYPDIKPEEIPPEVWQEVKQGKNLLDAYVRHENKSLKDKLNGFQTREQAAQANQANANSSTGSAKGNGLPDSGFISKEVFEANKGNQKWMYDNYDKVRKSMGKWR